MGALSGSGESWRAGVVEETADGALSGVLAGGARCVRLDVNEGAISADLDGADGKGGGITATVGISALVFDTENTVGWVATTSTPGGLDGKTRFSV